MLLRGIKTSSLFKYVGNVCKMKILLSFWRLLVEA